MAKLVVFPPGHLTKGHCRLQGQVVQFVRGKPLVGVLCLPGETSLVGNDDIGLSCVWRLVYVGMAHVGT